MLSTLLRYFVITEKKPKMTHDELSKKLKGLWHDSFKAPGYQALRAVVELHKPEPLDERGNVCLTCCPDLLTLYPCPTIQAIEKELK